MALIKCPKCGKEISDKATVCPKCGKNFQNKEESTVSHQNLTNQKFRSKKGKMGVILGIVCMLVLIGVLYFQKANNSENSVKKQKQEKNVTESVKKSEEKASGKDEAASELQEMQIGESVEVHTIYGNLKLTIDAIRKSDWIQRAGDTSGTTYAALMELDVENIDYEDPYNAHLYLNPFLGVYDDKNYVVQVSGTGYEDGQYAMILQVPKGARGKVVIPYVVNSDTQSLSININNEYVLKTGISE